jgi:hypothetical protein
MNKTSLEQQQSFPFWKGRVAYTPSSRRSESDRAATFSYRDSPVWWFPRRSGSSGRDPIYIDIAEETFNLDPNQLSPVLTPRTKAVIVQHTFGLAADFDAIEAITAPRGIGIVEDCAHTMGTLCHGSPVGTLGDAASSAHSGRSRSRRVWAGLQRPRIPKLPSAFKPLHGSAPAHRSGKGVYCAYSRISTGSFLGRLCTGPPSTFCICWQERVCLSALPQMGTGRKHARRLRKEYGSFSGAVA